MTNDEHSIDEHSNGTAKQQVNASLSSGSLLFDCSIIRLFVTRLLSFKMFLSLKGCDIPTKATPREQIRGCLSL